MPTQEPHTVRTARIDFIDLPIKLVHIPLERYAHYVQPLLQTLFPLADPSSETGTTEGWQSPPNETAAWMNQQLFLNLSITPIECSIFCSSELAERYFGAAAKASGTGVSISQDDYTAILMEGEGLDAGQRVLELTAPLAMAGISIFFITTYFSDYILVPRKAHGEVVAALEARGFVFDADPRDAPHALTHADRPHHHRRMTNSAGSAADLSVSAHDADDSAPPTLTELQARTVALLQRAHIAPHVERGLRLIHCGGRSDSAAAADLQVGLVRCLVHPPRFMSVTLTGTEPPSLLLEPAHADAAFGGASGAATGLARAVDDVLVPIVLDLGRLESSGIVCGLAGKLASGHAPAAQPPDASPRSAAPIEMSYLSTARGAAVLVGEDEVARAVEALRAGGVDGGGMAVTGYD